MLSFLGADKKVRRGRPRLVLLRAIGEVAREDGWSREVDHEALEGLLIDALGQGSRE
jgi:3-dehydroquinate synthetase